MYQYFLFLPALEVGMEKRDSGVEEEGAGVVVGLLGVA